MRAREVLGLSRMGEYGGFFPPGVSLPVDYRSIIGLLVTRDMGKFVEIDVNT